MRRLAALLCVAFALPALADEEAGLDCTLDFSMKGWAVFVSRGSGEGTIHCSDGQSAAVTLSSRGVGLQAGTADLENGHGEFTPVASLEELYGRYLASTRGASAGEGAAVGALVKGEVALGLYSAGEGIGLSSIGLNEVTISPKAKASAD